VLRPGWINDGLVGIVGVGASPALHDLGVAGTVLAGGKPEQLEGGRVDGSALGGGLVVGVGAQVDLPDLVAGELGNFRQVKPRMALEEDGAKLFVDQRCAGVPVAGLDFP
jgi:hypothetical protein